MLENEITVEEILDIIPKSAAEFCDEQLTADGLAAELADGELFSRKGLCEYLGIGESTLTGWLKEKRIPQAAKNAYVSLHLLGILQQEIKRLRADATGPKILKTGDTYAVCSFPEDEDGVVVGQVLAEGISKFTHARLLGSSLKSLNLLKETRVAIEYVRDMTENERFYEQMRSLDEDIQSLIHFVGDIDNWRELFGKRRHDKFIKELNEKVGTLSDKDPTGGGTENEESRS